MIATIVKIPIGPSFVSIINYNEEKVMKGEGERLMNTTNSLEPHEMARPFERQLAINPRVYKNQLVKIVVSFSPEDTQKLTNDLINEVTDKVFKELGYEGALLAYYHNDMDHHHLHLYATTVDENGQKIQEYKDYDKLEEIMRSQELRYGLTTVIENERTGTGLPERQMEQYSLHKSLSQQDEFYRQMEGFLRPSTVQEFIAQPQSNTQILDRVGAEFGTDAQNKVYELFSREDKKKLHKQILVDKLDNILSGSSDSRDYFTRISEAGLYSRIIYNRQGKPVISYGSKANSFYLTEKRLPTRFHLNRINMLGKAPDPVAQERMKQRDFIKNRVFKSLTTSASLYQFENSLYLRGVRVITHSNSSGVYGLSFESRHVTNPILFKGSQIHRSLSFNKISDRILSNSPVFDSSFYDDVATTVRQEKQQAVTRTTPSVGKLARKLETNEEQEERMRKPGLEQ